MRVLVLIGDIVRSRDSADRNAVQRRFQALLDGLNQDHAALLSPYTITLGDEFQAVLADVGAALMDVVAIQAGLYPQQLRFSFALGDLTTDINPREAIGMDGPAFHSARDGIQHMKKRGHLLQFSGLPADVEDMINCSLRIADLGMRKWQKNRFDIMCALHRGDNAQEIGEQLGISDKAVYKNIRDGGIDDILELFGHIARRANRSLGEL